MCMYIYIYIIIIGFPYNVFFTHTLRVYIYIFYKYKFHIQCFIYTYVMYWYKINTCAYIYIHIETHTHTHMYVCVYVNYYKFYIQHINDIDTISLSHEGQRKGAGTCRRTWTTAPPVWILRTPVSWHGWLPTGVSRKMIYEMMGKNQKKITSLGVSFFERVGFLVGYWMKLGWYHEKIWKTYRTIWKLAGWSFMLRVENCWKGVEW